MHRVWLRSKDALSALSLLGVLALPGCVHTAGLVEAMAKDPASVCVHLNTVYGTVRVYRTGIANGVMQCNQDGMAVKSVLSGGSGT